MPSKGSEVVRGRWATYSHACPTKYINIIENLIKNRTPHSPSLLPVTQHADPPKIKITTTVNTPERMTCPNKKPNKNLTTTSCPHLGTSQSHSKSELKASEMRHHPPKTKTAAHIYWPTSLGQESSSPCQSIPIQPMPPFPVQTMISLTPPNPPSFLSISPDNTQPIGRMLVGREWYDLINILFLSPGFLGRGMVCYLTHRGNVFYVTKDYWVCVLWSQDVLNEVNMMKHIQHINSVPKLLGYVLVCPCGAQGWFNLIWTCGRWHGKIQEG